MDGFQVFRWSYSRVSFLSFLFWFARRTAPGGNWIPECFTSCTLAPCSFLQKPLIPDYDFSFVEMDQGGTTGDGPGERPTKTKPVKPPATTGSSKTDTSFLAAESLCILAFSLAAFLNRTPSKR